jgi:hypothetical protein
MKCKEAVFMAVSYRPDEGAFLETGHVLLKKIVAQPLRERQTVATRMLQKFCLAGHHPFFAKRSNKHSAQPFRSRRYAAYCGQTPNTVVIPQAVQIFATGDPGSSRVGEFHALATLSCWARAALRASGSPAGGRLPLAAGRWRAGVAVHDPLLRVVGIGFGQAVGVAFGCDLLPVCEV